MATDNRLPAVAFGRLPPLFFDLLDSLSPGEDPLDGVGIKA